MAYEVENKYRLGIDPAAFLRDATDLAGAAFAEAIIQVDRYFDHPQRSFAETDEAFRIRSVGKSNRLTYKGPKLDAEAKTRREIEVAFAEGPAEAESLGQLVEALGFKPVREVRKTRAKLSFERDGRSFALVHDHLEGLGHFTEIETIAREESDLPAARDAILQLAADLKLSDPIRESYLEMLMR